MNAPSKLSLVTAVAHRGNFECSDEDLASELKEEKGRLRQQAELIDQRAARLATEQQELDKVRQDLETLRKEIAERVIEIDTAEAKNLRTLAQTYSGLTPTAAVTVIREMEDVTVVKILSLMKPDTVAAIFDQLPCTSAWTSARSS